MIETYFARYAARNIRVALSTTSSMRSARGEGGLEDEGQEQRRLAHLHELRGGELAIVDHEIAEL